ncbi:MAG: hypothetical protein R2867_14200 [Caldilineaceae bacterium]
MSESLALQAARQSTLILVVVALVGIYLLVQAAFGGWWLALGVVLTFPGPLSGGLIGALLTGGVLSLGSALWAAGNIGHCRSQQSGDHQPYPTA